MNQRQEYSYPQPFPPSSSTLLLSPNTHTRSLTLLTQATSGDSINCWILSLVVVMAAFFFSSSLVSTRSIRSTFFSLDFLCRYSCDRCSISLILHTQFDVVLRSVCLLCTLFSQFFSSSPRVLWCLRTDISRVS